MIKNILSTNIYIIITALDFSKAFDTVRHVTLLQKLAQLNIPDCVYIWMVDFFSGHTHCTGSLGGLTSAFLPITSSDVTIRLYRFRSISIRFFDQQFDLDSIWFRFFTTCTPLLTQLDSCVAAWERQCCGTGHPRSYPPHRCRHRR